MALPCKDCPQKETCEKSEKPIYLGSISRNDQPTPEACFYFCCDAGVLSGLQTIRRERGKIVGLVAFGTTHKPFLNSMIQGRYVMVGNDQEFKEGDVVVKNQGKTYKLTNITNR